MSLRMQQVIIKPKKNFVYLLLTVFYLDIKIFLA